MGGFFVVLKYLGGAALGSLGFVRDRARMQLRARVDIIRPGIDGMVKLIKIVWIWT